MRKKKPPLSSKKKITDSPKHKFVVVRLPTAKQEKFKAYCEKFDISMSRMLGEYIESCLVKSTIKTKR